MSELVLVAIGITMAVTFWIACGIAALVFQQRFISRTFPHIAHIVRLPASMVMLALACGPVALRIELADRKAAQ